MNVKFMLRELQMIKTYSDTRKLGQNTDTQLTESLESLTVIMLNHLMHGIMEMIIMQLQHYLMHG